MNMYSDDRPALRAPLLDDDAGDVAPLRRTTPAQRLAQPERAARPIGRDDEIASRKWRDICDDESCSPEGRSAGGCDCDEPEAVDPLPRLTAPVAPTHTRRPRALGCAALLAFTLSLGAVIVASSGETSVAPGTIGGVQLAATLRKASIAAQSALHSAAAEQQRAARQQQLRRRRAAARRHEKIQRHRAAARHKTLARRRAAARARPRANGQRPAPTAATPPRPAPPTSPSEEFAF
jgi:hypothetical protein